MRLILISPPDLTPEQRPIYEDMKAGISVKYSAFRPSAMTERFLGTSPSWALQMVARLPAHRLRPSGLPSCLRVLGPHSFQTWMT